MGMFTMTKHSASGRVQACTEIRIVLASGTVIGTGFASDAANATAYAVREAYESGFRDAACGHDRIAEYTARAFGGTSRYYSPIPATERD